MTDDQAKIAIVLGILWLICRPPGMSSVAMTWTDPTTGEQKPIIVDSTRYYAPDDTGNSDYVDNTGTVPDDTLSWLRNLMSE